MISTLLDIGETIAGFLVLLFVVAVVGGLALIGVFESICWMRRLK